MALNSRPVSAALDGECCSRPRDRSSERRASDERHGVRRAHNRRRVGVPILAELLRIVVASGVLSKGQRYAKPTVWSVVAVELSTVVAREPSHDRKP
jgi:hypothetical protein